MSSVTYVMSDQTSSGLHAENGDDIEVLFGGTTSASVVSSGGFEGVAGVANGTILSSGGIQDVFSGGIANATAVSGGGQIVESGGVASGTILSGTGDAYATVDVSSGGVVSTVSAGPFGGIYIHDGGEAVDSFILSGWEYVSGGAVATGTTVENGNLYVEAGGSAVSAVISSGARFNVSAGGTVLDATVYGVEFLAGTDSGTMIGVSGFQQILPGGVAVGDTVSGGFQFISNGGLASGSVAAVSTSHPVASPAVQS